MISLCSSDYLLKAANRMIGVAALVLKRSLLSAIEARLGEQIPDTKRSIRRSILGNPV